MAQYLKVFAVTLLAIIVGLALYELVAGRAIKGVIPRA